MRDKESSSKKAREYSTSETVCKTTHLIDIRDRRAKYRLLQMIANAAIPIRRVRSKPFPVYQFAHHHFKTVLCRPDAICVCVCVRERERERESERERERVRDPAKFADVNPYYIQGSLITARPQSTEKEYEAL